MSERIDFNLDKEWKFHAGEFDTGGENTHANSYMISKAGSFAAFDDTDWRTLDLPHDLFCETEFSPNNLLSHGYKTRSNAWYQKTFRLDESLAGKQLTLVFEGIAVSSVIYFNGSVAARSFSAYAETTIDITERAHFGDRLNTIAVRIDGFDTEGWWYEGAGIYRHVRLIAKNPLHIAHNGMWVKPVFQKSHEKCWTVELETTVENSAFRKSDYKVRSAVYDGDRLIVEKTTSLLNAPSDGCSVAQLSLPVDDPELWDVDHPKLYRAVSEIVSGAKIIDSDSANFGFRTIRFDAEKGFFLNGRPLKLKGACNHQDHAGVGVAVPDSIQFWRVKRLKEMGLNAYRCSHNLPAREILDACDRYGMLVMDENRRFESRPDVLKNVRDMVLRDRNHPCVIMYSLFNEEPLQGTAEGAKIFCKMKSAVKKLDDTRYVTGAMNGGIMNDEGAALRMDVTGVNYSIHSIDAFHEKYPQQPLVGSENNSAVSTRGCCKSDREKHVLDCYDDERVPWGQLIRETWDYVRSRDFMSGIFIWTGFDYRGEPTPFSWPTSSSLFGIMDTCGFAKDSFYFNKACFTSTPMMHVMPHWNHKCGDVVRVSAATNCEEAEIFVNGVSLGRKAADVCRPIEWLVQYAPGTLEAVGYNSGKEAARDTVHTAGKPARLKINTDRTAINGDGADTVPLNVCALDQNGNIVPTASNLVRFTVSGDGALIGVGNGDPNCHESDKLPWRSLFAGWCQGLLQAAAGAKKLEVTVSSEGLESDSVSFEIGDGAIPNYLYSAVNSEIKSWTVSTETFADKPDALVEIADSDMNSFEPITFGDGYQDFTSGYKIYRAILKLPKSSDPGRITPDGIRYTLRLGEVNGSVDVYRDGKLLFSGEEKALPVEVGFTGLAGAKTELRLLVKAEEGEKSGVKWGARLI